MFLFACYVVNRRLKSEMSALERLNNAIPLLKNKKKMKWQMYQSFTFLHYNIQCSFFIFFVCMYKLYTVSIAVMSICFKASIFCAYIGMSLHNVSSVLAFLGNFLLVVIINKLFL